MQKTAYEMRISDWSSDVCSSDLLIGTGSEVQLAVTAREQLAAKGIKARVVSMPCIEWFNEQDEAYRAAVIPVSVKARVSVEAGIAQGWRELVGDAGRIISIEQYEIGRAHV